MKLDFKQNGIVGFFIQYPRWIKIKTKPFRIVVKPKLRHESRTVCIDGKIVERIFYTFRAFAIHYFYELFLIPFRAFLLELKLNPRLGAIAFDLHTTGSADSASADISFSHTVTGSNVFLSVNIINNTGGVTAITYNSVSMTQHHVKANANIGTECQQWKLLAPATGSNTVQLTNASSKRVSALADSFSGADQSTQPDGAATNSASTTATIVVDVVTSIANTIVIDCASSNSATIPSVGAGQTSRYTEESAGRGSGVSTEPTTSPATVTMSWTIDDSYWCTAAFGIREGAAAEVRGGILMAVLAM